MLRVIYYKQGSFYVLINELNVAYARDDIFRDELLMNLLHELLLHELDVVLVKLNKVISMS